MCGVEARRLDPELREIVAEASRALALLDADRLEELARCCQALNRDPLGLTGLARGDAERADIVRQAREAAGEMAVFARVLDATRANLTVMKRLRALREGNLGYTDAGAQNARWVLPEGGHGND
jgi:hypothetical protein